MTGMSSDPVNDNTPPPELKWFSRFLLWLAGADVKILTTQCPEDIPKILAQVSLLVGTFIYSSAVLTMIANRLFEQSGHFNFGLMLGAIGVSALVGLSDAYVFLHCSWLQSGIIELKTAGLELSLPWTQRIKAGLFLANRSVLAGCFAYIIGTCLGLLTFSADILSYSERVYLKSNAAVVAQVSGPIDAEIKSAKDEVDLQTAAIKALSKQATALRQNEVNWITRSASIKHKAEPVPEGQTSRFEARLDEEKARLETVKKKLADLVQGRNAAIRKAVDGAPNHIPYDGDGFLGQTRALAAIASEDGKVAFLVIVLEAVAVGIELAAIFAKLFGFNPTTYAAIVARDYFVRISRMADAMEDELANDAADSAHVDPAEEPANDNLFGDESHTPANDNFLPEQPVKRKRGRPRKHPPPATNGSGKAIPEE